MFPVRMASRVREKCHANDRWGYPGRLRVAELFFDVPLNYNKPNDGTLRLFARSVRRLVTPAEPSETPKDDKQLPFLVYLQGGPGMGCRPPQEYGWIGTVLEKGYQVNKPTEQ